MAEGFTVHDRAAALADFLDRHPKALVLTGAGLSTASGIPDYRDRDGVRRGKMPILGPEFRKSPALQRRYWARSMAGWPVLAQAAPNPGHHALAALETAGRIGPLLTQNVDGLHQRAGSRDLLELHGNIHVVVCLGCRARLARSFVQTRLLAANSGFAGARATAAPDGDALLEPAALAAFALPRCLNCQGSLSPDVVFFGDGLPAPRSAEALARIERADALLVVGSSLMVHSAFRLCRLAAQAGKPIAALNIGRTRADELISLKIEEAAERVLPMAAQWLLPGGAPLPVQPSEVSP